jgi:hypothetical protein
VNTQGKVTQTQGNKEFEESLDKDSGLDLEIKKTQQGSKQETQSAIQSRSEQEGKQANNSEVEVIDAKARLFRGIFIPSTKILIWGIAGLLLLQNGAKMLYADVVLHGNTTLEVYNFKLTASDAGIWLILGGCFILLLILLYRPVFLKTKDKIPDEVLKQAVEQANPLTFFKEWISSKVSNAVNGKGKTKGS